MAIRFIGRSRPFDAVNTVQLSRNYTIRILFYNSFNLERLSYQTSYHYHSLLCWPGISFVSTYGYRGYTGYLPRFRHLCLLPKCNFMVTTGYLGYFLHLPTTTPVILLTRQDYVLSCYSTITISFCKHIYPISWYFLALSDISAQPSIRHIPHTSL